MGEKERQRKRGQRSRTRREVLACSREEKNKTGPMPADGGGRRGRVQVRDSRVKDGVGGGLGREEGEAPVMRGFTPRIINASSCATSRSATGGRLHRDKCKAADLLIRLLSTGCSQSTRISRRHGIMATEFINAFLKLHSRDGYLMQAGSMWLFSAESVSNKRYVVLILCSRVVNGCSNFFTEKFSRIIYVK